MYFANVRFAQWNNVGIQVYFAVNPILKNMMELFEWISAD